MAIRGIFQSDSNIPGTRKGDFASAILQMFPTGSASLFALTAGMADADAMDPIVTWFEESHITGRQTVTVSASVSGTTLGLDDASSYNATGTLLLVEETGEYLYVSSISGTTITISRGFAATTAIGISVGFHVQRIGTSYEEASSRPTGVANLGYPVFNVMQIFRNSWDVSGTARATSFYTGDPVAKNKRDAMQFHSEDIERSLWWGKRTWGVRNGHPFRTFNGVTSIIQTNITTAGGTTTYAQLNSFLQPIFEKNIRGAPNERIAFCGNGALTVINNIAKNNSTIFIEPGETEFGLRVNKWITPYGDISLMTHPLLTESPYFTKNLYVLHPGAIRMRWLRRTFTDAYDKDGTRAGIDADYGVITSECTCEYHIEKTGGQLLQMQAAG